MNKLEQLKQFSTIVADTGDIEAIRQYQPLDATTNPSLLLKASQLPQYQPLIQQAISFASTHAGSSVEQLNLAADKLATLIGKEILGIVEGRVSTEVDARLSFDQRATIEKARQLINLYEQLNIDRSRVLIKIASTWEGIKAARVLQKEGINCNLTLLFSFEQAIACADAGAFLISPFVGRIYDWYKKDQGKDHFEPHDDPGVQSVSRIFEHYKSHGFETIVMGASFRNTGQIEALAGCDRLTISPALLQQLSEDKGELPRMLDASALEPKPSESPIDETAFRWALNENAMATEKLAEGIRQFAKDQITLEQDVLKTGEGE